MKLQGRVLRLEKLAGPSGDIESMDDCQLIAELQKMVRAEPYRRWEELLPGMATACRECWRKRGRQRRVIPGHEDHIV